MKLLGYNHNKANYAKIGATSYGTVVIWGTDLHLADMNIKINALKVWISLDDMGGMSEQPQ